MKLFIDDERMPPEPSWQWVVFREPGTAIAHIVRYAGRTDILSLDHDLGENVPTGYDIAAWMEKEVYTNGLIPPRVLRVHSANPVGKKRILSCFESIARFCEQNGMEVPKIEVV